MVRLMHYLADEMEAGTLWEDGESEGSAAPPWPTECTMCGRPSPTTPEGFDPPWAMVQAGGENVGLICPACREGLHGNGE